jgi:predicted RNA-binding protein with PUA-like domain
MKSRKWLMKTEPNVYSIDDLEREKKTQWEGIRNYQARNFMMKDMRIGDQVLIYHSNATPPGIVGLATVASEPYPDYFAWDDASKYFDPKSTQDNPRWYMVDVTFEKKFNAMISLEQLKNDRNLKDMMVTKKGSRLSIQPVESGEFEYIIKTYTA